MPKVSRESRLGVSMASVVCLLDERGAELLGADSPSLSIDVLGFEIIHPVRIVVGETVHVDAPLQVAVLPFRLESDPGSGWFPMLDAELEVIASVDVGVNVALEGEYRPPAGALGAVADRIGLHKVADAAVDRYFAGITDRLGSEAAALDALLGVPV